MRRRGGGNVNPNGLHRLSATRAAVNVHGKSLRKELKQIGVRRVSKILVSCSMASLLLLCGAVSASAHGHYIFTGSFGEAGSGAGQLSLTFGSGTQGGTAGSGVAVNSETHDVYVADTANNRVDEFEADGKFVRAWGWGVVNGAAELQTCTVSCEQGLSGTAPGEFEAPASISIDNTTGGDGDIYVADVGEKGESSTNVVAKFNSEGDLIEGWGVKGQLRGTPANLFAGTSSIAVDSSGNLWVSAKEDEQIYEFNQSGDFIQSADTEGLRDLVFDDSGTLYAQDPFGRSVVYNAKIGEFSNGVATSHNLDGEISSTGMAVDPVSDEIYVGSDGFVERFASGCQVLYREYQGEPPYIGHGCIPLESFGSPELIGGTNLSVDSGTGVVYVIKPGTDAVDVFAPEVIRPPTIESESVSAVKSDSATFGVDINPNGSVTSYRVEYGPTASYSENAPVSDSLVGGGFDAQELSVHVQGLEAQKTYHYRVVSHNEKGTTYGEDRTFITQPAATAVALPDEREWELVTPAEKYGALFLAQNSGAEIIGTTPNPLVGEASVNGDAMIDLASAPTESGPHGYVKDVSVFSTRGADGWSSQVIAPPHKEAAGPSIAQAGEYVFFSEDLSRGILDPFGSFTPLSPEANESTPYLHADYLKGNVSEHCESGCDLPLVTQADTPGGEKFGGKEEVNGGCTLGGGITICGPTFVAATPDASFVALSSEVQLTSMPNETEYAGSPYSYYEWGNGQIQPLYMLPESEGGRGVYAGSLSGATHQLSDDGSVFFTYEGHLYLHDFDRDESVRLDVAQGSSEPAAGGASFLYASADGSRVLFNDSKQLTDAAGSGIYECQIVDTAGDAPGCDLRLTNLALGTLIGGSTDASYLYFKDVNRHLIVDHYNGGEWSTTDGPYVGTWPQSPTDIAGFPEGTSVSEVSPDGRWLTFMSEEELAGYDNHDAVSGRPDVEVYLYDAESNKLACASCDPTGARPVGVEYEAQDQNRLVAGSLKGFTASGGGDQWVAANLPPWTKATKLPHEDNFYQPRFLSDGGRLFFNSHDALVPQDVNGTQDVYEWEPPGVGDCTTATAGFSERSGGCLGLVSSGASAEESAFMDASGSGGDVFFITSAKLVSQDFDNALDVYDAHECTADSPCAAPEPVSPPACSTGDGCKAAPTPQPSIFGAPSSATFSGAGNVSSPVAPVAKIPERKSLSRAQKLARALKACTKKRRSGRAACQRTARKRYGKVANRGKRG